MRVLVTAASKHGSTSDIAQAIGLALSDRHIDADVWSIDAVQTLDDYDAVVLGSAVYMGHWLDAATRFVKRHEAAMRERPVWLFSSGPLGDPAKPEGFPADADEMTAATQAREHVVFAGSLDKEDLGFGERAIVAAVRVPAGDFRPWDEIDAWAFRIADSLAVESADAVRA